MTPQRFSQVGIITPLNQFKCLACGDERVLIKLIAD